MAVDRFEAELKSKYKDECKFWNDYFKARDEYYMQEWDLNILLIL